MGQLCSYRSITCVNVTTGVIWTSSDSLVVEQFMALRPFRIECGSSWDEADRQFELESNSVSLILAYSICIHMNSSIIITSGLFEYVSAIVGVRHEREGREKVQRRGLRIMIPCLKAYAR